jgi:hypothetical protein
MHQQQCGKCGSQESECTVLPVAFVKILFGSSYTPAADKTVDHICLGCSRSNEADGAILDKKPAQRSMIFCMAGGCKGVGACCVEDQHVSKYLNTRSSNRVKGQNVAVKQGDTSSFGFPVTSAGRQTFIKNLCCQMCYNCIVLNPQKDKKRKAAALTNAGEEQGSADEVAAASFTAQQLGTDTDTYIHTYIHFIHCTQYTTLIVSYLLHPISCIPSSASHVLYLTRCIPSIPSHPSIVSIVCCTLH